MSEEENVEKIPSNEKPKSYVVEGATLKCGCGDKECNLKTPGRKSILIQGKLQANIMDFKPMVNIPPFGKCRSLTNPTVAAATSANHGRLKKMPCIPNVTMPWILGKEDMLADEAPALLDCSKNMCIWGGEISITDDGQNVKSARPKDEERIKMGKEKMNDGGMMMLIGVGALLTGIAILTLPLSIPTLLVGAGVSVAVATATGVTVGAGIAAVGATVMKTGRSEALEGAQDIAYGNAGINLPSFNPVRDIDFRGNQEAYDQTKGILTTVAAVGTILLAPVVEMNAPSTMPNPGKTNATEQTAKAGNTAAGKFKLARGWGKSTTSALKLKSGKIDAVGQTKAAANAGTRAKLKTSLNSRPKSVVSIKESKAAFERASKAKKSLLNTKEYNAKTVSSDKDKSLSGWKQPRPEGFKGTIPEQVQAKSEKIGHKLEAHPYDKDFTGQYNASHAEKQMSIISPNDPIGVSKSMCRDCQNYFSKLAQSEGIDQIVTDPNGTWIFHSDGNITSPIKP